MSSQHEATAEAPDIATTRSAWAPFKSRAFAWLWLANVVSALGTSIQNAASAWIMTDLAPSPIMVSLVQAAAQLPVLLLALPAGALADLMDRKRHLILTNMLMLAASAILAIVAALGRVDSTILLSLTFLLAVGAALNGPAWAASVPLTVPRPSLTQALVLNSVGFNIARAIGPALGGLILAILGATVAFAANAASFAFVGVVVGIMLTFPRTQGTNNVPPERFRSAMRIGFSYALAEPVVRSTLLRSSSILRLR
jgi:MFS family permease